MWICVSLPDYAILSAKWDSGDVGDNQCLILRGDICLVHYRESEYLI